MFAYYGWKETVLSRHAKPEAGQVTAESLEEGKIPENGHVLIDHAWALYPYAVYHYSKPNGSNDPATPNTKATNVIYPVISLNHPLVKALTSGSTDKNAIDQALAKVAIVVKTNRFATVGSIPSKAQNVDTLEGLIINNVESLEAKDLKLLHESFPEMDASKVVFIEQGRQPKPLLACLGMIAGGVVAALLGGLWIIARR